jgi:hypothetical protein
MDGSYDDNAFVFFFVTLLVIFLVPSGIYITGRLIASRPTTQVGGADLPKTKAESRKQTAIAREKAGEKIWSPFFTILFISFVLGCATLVVTLVVLNSVAYDPYAVRINKGLVLPFCVGYLAPLLP